MPRDGPVFTHVNDPKNITDTRFTNHAPASAPVSASPLRGLQQPVSQRPHLAASRAVVTKDRRRPGVRNRTPSDDRRRAMADGFCGVRWSFGVRHEVQLAAGPRSSGAPSRIWLQPAGLAIAVRLSALLSATRAGSVAESTPAAQRAAVRRRAASTTNARRRSRSLTSSPLAPVIISASCGTVCHQAASAMRANTRCAGSSPASRTPSR